MKAKKMKMKQKILIVDDKKANLVALEKVLKELDVEIIKAISGNEALTASLNDDFALAILDVQMPEMDGYELAEILRSEDKTKNLPIIFLSAVYSDDSHVLKAYEAGGVDFLIKPYDLYHLLSKVRIFLQLDRQKEELIEKIELEKSKNYLESILMSVDDSIVVISLDAEIITVNNAALATFGYKYNEMIGLKIDDLFDDDIFSTWEHSLKNYLSTQDKNKLSFPKTETTIKARDQKIIPVLISGSALINVEGDVKGAVFVAINISERLLAEKKIQKLNEELEERVKERTLQLEISNKELESFSYSVSHDLRAPLRSIDGFSQALIEEYSDKLDEQGNDYLNRVRSSAQKMSELIDGMLNLAKVTRVALRFGSVNLSAIAKSIAKELRENDKKRTAEFSIAPNLTDTADATLIEAALRNLLENAWKFTSKKPETRIEFGMMKTEGKKTYFVRDNGAGFNMEYADKLFTPFQRLHQPAEFAGTGIGLATIQRIIHRHNGKVWAEGEVENLSVGKAGGATFYFTLNS
jgi:PAS domain S-box-containing protein